MPTFRANTAVDPQQIATGFDSIAKMFAPPSAQELYAGAKTQETRQRIEHIRELYDYAKNPNFDRSRFDPMAIAGGLYSPNQSYYSVDLADRRSGLNNAADNARALDQTRIQQAGETERNANTVRGSVIVGMYKPQAPGEARPEVPAEVAARVGLPPLAAVYGSPKPRTETEAKGEAFARLPEDQQRDAAFGSTPVETIIRNGMPEIQARRRAIGAAPAPTAAPPSNLARLQAERDALPANDSRRAEYDSAIAAEGRGATADAFSTEAGTAAAKTYGEMAKAGQQARGFGSDLDVLDALLADTPTGITAETRLRVAGYAKELGLHDVASGLTGGQMDRMTAANAIAQRIAPALRVPGSGAQSDRELQNFLASLPSILNQPGGNRLILDTLRGGAQYKQAVGDIAGRALRGEISRAEADAQIAATPTPFARFSATERAASGPAGGSASAAGGPPSGVVPTPGHIAALRANPDKAADFDAKFGPGAAATVLGSGR